MTERTIYALGFFDGVHIGHAALLRACRRMADEQGCKAGVLTFTTHPDALVLGKMPALINTSADRKRMLLERFSMDVVTELPFDRAMMELSWQNFFRLLITEHHTAGLVCGADFRFGSRGAGNARLLEEACKAEGVPCVVVQQQKIDGIPVSSTYIRKLLEEGQMEQAVRFLGHPHMLTGTVVSGRKLGRTLGIPTANLHLPPEVVCLRHGVYACKVRIEGRQYLAVTNVGTRPTVGGHRTTVEPWLLDFDGELYGKELTLEFYEFLRPEQKFPSLEALKEEIKKNAVQVRKIFQNK
ncbi:MAG: bifunctional riboflavin kinase/FAD synthetase [Oscillospiraceae bacterium]|nr:bifunctional riboflavin kinase/FAD synthetase [Oscillospiraceae bacterium]